MNRKFMEAVKEAIGNELLIVIIIDDHTTIHTKRRPTDQSLAQASTMCTVVCRILEEIPAIPVASLTQLHNPEGLDSEYLSAELTSPSSMENIALAYASFMPSWIKSEFFDADSERHRLMIHMYHQSDNVRKLRCLENLHLVEFRMQQLQSKANFGSKIRFDTMPLVHVGSLK